MESAESSALPTRLIGQVVVVDLSAPYVCVGTLVGQDATFLELTDADLHDFRDSAASREVYVYDSARLGVRRNRARVYLRRDEVVAITRLADIATS
jgi:hypothetical protein